MDTPINIVLVEDHDALREVTADVLREAGYQVIALAYAEDLDEEVGGSHVDIYLLDINLPGENGLSLAQRLRQTHPSVGIIMVTARNSSEEQAIGYENGADIYLVKPQSPQTLLAAIQSLTRRIHPADQTHTLRLNERQLTLHGPLNEITLQEMDARILIAFLRAHNQRLETWQIADLIGMDEDAPSKSAIEVRITRLRKKMRSCGAADNCIKALRTIGYQLCENICVS